MPMQTIVHTRFFATSAKHCGFTEQDTEKLETMLAKNPEAGDEIKGSGGCRKVRVAGRGKGKSGGYRVITFFSGPAYPVFLLVVYSKGMQEDISDEDVSGFRKLTKELLTAYKPRMVKAPKR